MSEKNRFDNHLTYVTKNEKDEFEDCSVSLVSDDGKHIPFSDIYDYYIKTLETKKDDVLNILAIARGLNMIHEAPIFVVGWIFKSIISSYEKKLGGKFNIKITKNAITEKEFRERQALQLEAYANFIRNGESETKDIAIDKIDTYE